MSYRSLDRIKEITDRNVLNLQEAKSAGKKVVGQYCIYSPEELAIAAGAIPVSLCGTKQDSIPAAEEILPRSLCPLIKSSFGFALQDSCPYLSASDIVVADTTCDGKKKMYELLAQYKPLFLLQLPQVQDEDAKSYWRGEFQRLRAHYETTFGIRITDADVHDAITLMNRLRIALKNVLDTAKRPNPPLSGMQLLEITFRLSFMSDKEAAIRLLDDLYEELKSVPEDSNAPKKPRLYVTGVPMGLGSHKLLTLLEECGASVVCVDNCACYKKTRLMIDEQADPMTALADRYLETPCSVMSPNPHRYTILQREVQEFSADAVVDLTWQGCQTYDVESHSLKHFVQDTLSLPFLQIVTDYSSTDTEQLKVRVEAFLEMLA